MDDLVQRILSDEKIDGKDKENLKKLTEELKIDKNEVYNESKKTIKSIMKEVFESTLEN
ncbi:hypothetical protein ACFLY2_01010 [Patescibacteria group bacterium]